MTDPSWTLSLAQSAKHYKKMTENWKDNTKGALVFVGGSMRVGISTS